MKYLEYVLSVLIALALLGGAAVWTHADYTDNTVRFACRAGKPSPAITLKGMVIYARCASTKRG
jgi:hypothetical protein